MASNDDFNELEGLLPFYINDSLSDRERLQIESALVTSSALREKLDEQIAISQVVKQQGEKMTEGGIDCEESLKGVLSQLTPQAAKGASSAPLPNLRNLLSFLNPGNWHAAVSLSLAVAVAGMGGTIIAQNQAGQERATQIASLEKKLSDAEFQLASGPGGGVTRGNIMIQLRDTAPWAAVDALLSAEGLTITSGPSDGALTLSSDAKGTALDALIVRLKASPLVASVDKAV
jgi:hypothetical protein